MSRSAVGVIGAGAWGLALAAAAARTEGETLVYSRRPLDSGLPDGVTRAKDLAELGARSRIIVLAVPSTAAAEVARELGNHVDGRHFVVHGVRGLAGDELETVSDIVRRESPARRVGALGGPVLEGELRAGAPSVMVCGSHYPEVTQAVSDAFTSPTLRVYRTDDLRGLEWASALVGVLAIGIGYARAVGLRPGLLSAVITRSMSEAARLAAAAGGSERTLLGLAGYGDLLAAITQENRPEVTIGMALGKGRSLDEAVREAELRVEAVDLVPRLAAWAERHKVRAPIVSALAKGVLTSREPGALVHELMTSPVTDQGV